ncbi:intercellular signal molecule [Lithospermum erythrorhizon]|uniref:Intercellular signal molecule n=1 Tax=Lithospermum erythrorhizon TaxID=34254 RepID=A0AAV3R7J0_LITER
MGSEKMVKAWSDPWMNGGSLEVLSNNCKKYLRRNEQLTVADLKNAANGWIWLVGLRGKKVTMELKAHVDSLQLDPNGVDTYVCLPSPNGLFSVRSMYEQLRHHGDSVKWKRLILQPSNIARHSFITWLLVRGRLETKDRVRKWLPRVDEKCVFFPEKENMQHLFFHCEYSGVIWRKLLGMLNVYGDSQCWDQEIQWLMEWHGKGQLQTLLMKLGLCATVYCISQERNNRMHGMQSLSYRRVAYGGLNGWYYSCSEGRMTGRDGVVLAEIKEEDKTIGESLHTISKGIRNKGHSITTKQSSGGQSDTLQTLHNLNEDELIGFDENWKDNADKYMPGWNSAFNTLGNAGIPELQLLDSICLSGNGGSDWEGFPSLIGWGGGWPFPSLEYYGSSGDVQPYDQSKGTTERARRAIPID